MLFRNGRKITYRTYEIQIDNQCFVKKDNKDHNRTDHKKDLLFDQDKFAQEPTKIDIGMNF